MHSGRLGVMYDSQATNTSAEGQGRLSQEVLPASYESPGRDTRLCLLAALLCTFFYSHLDLG